MISWQDFIDNEYRSDDGYLKKIFTFLKDEQRAGRTVCPKNSDVFNAFKYTPRDQVRVVIVGQDPYPGAGQAHGLAFSVPPGVGIPHTLANIYQEVKDDTGKFTKCEGGCLVPWAEQGVLLLNRYLTCQLGKIGSHAGIGWTKFTDSVIREITENSPHTIFVLWGLRAKEVLPLIQEGQTIVTSAHPSPLSANQGFFGSKPFSYINKTLQARGEDPIVW